FSGDPETILKKVYAEQPQLLAASCSAASMWAANAATVTPSIDSADRRVHITPANLITTWHRSQEVTLTRRVLKTIFADECYFVHHEPLPGVLALADEGAANHTRFS